MNSEEIAKLIEKRKSYDSDQRFIKLKLAYDDFNRLFKDILCVESYNYCVEKMFRYVSGKKFDHWKNNPEGLIRLFKEEFVFAKEKVYLKDNIQDYVKLAIIKNLHRRLLDQNLNDTQDIISLSFLAERYEVLSKVLLKAQDPMVPMLKNFHMDMLTLTREMLEQFIESPKPELIKTIPSYIIEHVDNNPFFDQELQLLLIGNCKNIKITSLTTKQSRMRIDEFTKHTIYSNLLFDYLVAAEHLNIPERMKTYEKNKCPEISAPLIDLIYEMNNLRKTKLTKHQIKNNLILIFDRTYETNEIFQ